MPSGSPTVRRTSEGPRRAPANFDTPADPGEAIRTGAANARRVLKLFGQRPATRPGHTVIRQDTEDAWFIPADSTFDDVVPLPIRRASSRLEPMARCPLCESDVPDGRPDCDACGQPFAKPPPTRVAPDAVRKAIESARKDLVASPRDPVDVAFPRGLLERAEQTEAAGDLGRALDLARASRRALDIIRRESRVADALKYADAVLQDAKQAGIETLAFQRNIEQARALAARGDHGTAERLLRRVSVRTLDQRRERILAASVEKAESRVRYALEGGGNVGGAPALP